MSNTDDSQYVPWTDEERDYWLTIEDSEFEEDLTIFCNGCWAPLPLEGYGWYCPECGLPDDE